MKSLKSLCKGFFDWLIWGMNHLKPIQLLPWSMRLSAIFSSQAPSPFSFNGAFSCVHLDYWICVTLLRLPRKNNSEQV